MENRLTNTALLVMDMQQGILNNFPSAKPLLENVAKAIAIARAQNMPVIYVVVGFRKGAPEVSLNNKSFGARKAGFDAINMDEFMKVHTDIAPQEGDIIVVKRRVSAFTGSDLEVVLRSLGVDHLVLAGISTSGVVLSTLIEAADRDYRLTVLSDCCVDPDAEVHELLMTKILSKRGDVLTVDEWGK